MVAAAFGVALYRVATARNTPSGRTGIAKFEQEIRKRCGRITFAIAGRLRLHHRLNEIVLGL
jgi:hypothetical protein